MQNRQIAQKLIDDGLYIIPLLPNSKRNNDVDIITKKYIRRPRVITSILASQYNKTSWDIAKINNKALTKLRRQYIIENNITYL